MPRDAYASARVIRLVGGKVGEDGGKDTRHRVVGVVGEDYAKIRRMGGYTAITVVNRGSPVGIPLCGDLAHSG